MVFTQFGNSAQLRMAQHSCTVFASINTEIVFEVIGLPGHCLTLNFYLLKATLILLADCEIKCFPYGASLIKLPSSLKYIGTDARLEREIKSDLVAERVTLSEQLVAMAIGTLRKWLPCFTSMVRPCGEVARSWLK